MMTLFCLFAASAAWGGSVGTSFHEEFHRTYKVAAEGRVFLENINGDVRIMAWDRDEVQVNAAKHAPSPERLDDAHIVVDKAGDVVSIKTSYALAPDSEETASVDYTVMVPRKARLDQVKLVNGTLEIAGLKGDVRASSVNGAIRTSGLVGDVKLSTVSGKLEAAFDELDASRSISMNSVSGSIEVLLPMDARADFQADTVSGGISSDFVPPVERNHVLGRHWNVALKGGGTRIKVTNVSGSISVTPVWHGRRIKFT
jgi:DUF4097 and DUF4098 domain-containing protein YvlB